MPGQSESNRAVRGLRSGQPEGSLPSVRTGPRVQEPRAAGGCGPLVPGADADLPGPHPVLPARGGAALAERGRKDEARAAYQAGIEVTTRKQDFHARGELEAALADLLSRST